MSYNFMRELADSWGLVYLVALFIGVVIFTFRPGSKQIAQDVAEIPFRENCNDE